MTSIAKIQQKLEQFDIAARRSTDAASLKKKWLKLFDLELSDRSAKSFAEYYREMRYNTRRMRGGSSLSPASLSSSGMVPGINVGTYGRFPIEAGVDGGADPIRDLDVYFRDSLTAGCGKEDISPHISRDMGSNKVGGRRTGKHNRKTYRKSRKTNRKSRKTNRKSRRNHRGGNLLETASMRLFNANAPPSYVQSVSNLWNGGTTPVPQPADPSIHVWNYKSHGSEMINPGVVADIGSSFDKLASPAPWQSST